MQHTLSSEQVLHPIFGLYLLAPPAAAWRHDKMRWCPTFVIIIGLLCSFACTVYAEAVPGLSATYYNSVGFTGDSVSRIDPVIDFDWAGGAPCTGISSDNFSVVWQGYLLPPTDGLYTIATNSDDGIEVIIGHTFIISNMTDHGSTRNTGTISLKAGQSYPIRVRFYDRGGQALVRLAWQYGTNPETVIPSANLSSELPPTTPTLPPGTGDGWVATYFQNSDFTGQSVTRNESAIDYNWGSGSPVTGIGEKSPWSATWQGQLEAPITDTYTISTLSSGSVRIFVDGQLVMNDSTRVYRKFSSFTVQLNGGTRHRFEIKFSSYGTEAQLKVWWSSTALFPELLPGNRIFAPQPDTTPFLWNHQLSSRVNPAWIAGTVNASTRTVTGQLNGQFVAITQDSKNSWYVNAAGAGMPAGVPLAEGKVTKLSVVAGGETLTKDLQWEPTDLNRSYGNDPTIIRVGDSLLLTSLAVGSVLEIDAAYNSNLGFKPGLTGKTNQNFPLRFATAGSFIVQSRIDGVLSGKITVHAVGADLRGPIACEINYQRIKDVGVTHPAFVTFTSNDPELMSVGFQGLIDGGQRLLLQPMASGDIVLAARIQGPQGPIVTSNPIDEFTMRTTAQRVIAIDETYPDGSMLGTADLIQAPAVLALDVVLKAFVSGVLFDNGTNQLQVNTSEFSPIAVSSNHESSYAYHVIRNSGVTTGFCHNFVVYQNGVQISY